MFNLTIIVVLNVVCIFYLTHLLCHDFLITPSLLSTWPLLVWVLPDSVLTSAHGVKCWPRCQLKWGWSLYMSVNIYNTGRISLGSHDLLKGFQDRFTQKIQPRHPGTPIIPLKLLWASIGFQEPQLVNTSLTIG